MAHVTVKKDEDLIITIDGMEGFPKKFTYTEVVDSVTDRIARDVRNDFYIKKNKEENAKMAAAGCAINSADVRSTGLGGKY